MNKIYRIKAIFSYLCVANNEKDAIEQFTDYCDWNHIQAGDFDKVDFDSVREVPKENE